MLIRIRQHHAIEHAAATILLARYTSPVTIAGLSDPAGFTLFGRFSRDEIESAVDEGIERLRAGESSLAITNQCGTNLGVTGTLTALAALAASRRRGGSISDAIVAATVASVLAVPAGRWLQRKATVEPRIGDLAVRSIHGRQVGSYTLWRVQVGRDAS